jgi:hypothetical protein
MGLKSAFLTFFSKLPQPARATKLITRTEVLNNCMMIFPFLNCAGYLSCESSHPRIPGNLVVTVPTRSVSDMDLSAAANDPPPSMSCSARKNRIRIIVATSPLSQACGLSSGRASFASSQKCRKGSYLRPFRASRISINNFSSLVGPAGGAGGAGGASFLNRLTCLTSMKITNAIIMKSKTVCKNTP